MPPVSFYFALIIIILGLLALISISWSNRRGAPWLPTRMKKVRRMLELANVQPGELVYDLGCGDGRVLVTAARRYGAKAVGIEIDLANVPRREDQMPVQSPFLGAKFDAVLGSQEQTAELCGLGESIQDRDVDRSHDRVG